MSVAAERPDIFIHSDPPQSRAVWIGVDVGLDGGIAAVSEGMAPRVHAMPTDTVSTGPASRPKKKRVVNGQSLRRIFVEFAAMANGGEVYVMIERPQLRPAVRHDSATGELKVNQGIVSQASFMEQFGLIRGVLIGLGIPYEDVHPATWKANIFHGASDKTDARRLAASLFPVVAQRFELKKNDGLAEATLIAEYARRHHGAAF